MQSSYKVVSNYTQEINSPLHQILRSYTFYLSSQPILNYDVEPTDQCRAKIHCWFLLNRFQALNYTPKEDPSSLMEKMKPLQKQGGSKCIPGHCSQLFQTCHFAVPWQASEGALIQQSTPTSHHFLASHATHFIYILSVKRMLCIMLQWYMRISS